MARAVAPHVCEHCAQTFFPKHHAGAKYVQRFCSRTCSFAVRMAARRGHIPPPDVAGCVWLELGDGYFTLIDATDAPVLREHMWSRGSGGYATTAAPNGRKLKLHQFLFPAVRRLDHRNRDRLDNRRMNLRPATASQNAANTGLRVTNTSGYKGVTTRRGRWIARVSVRGVRLHVGCFDTREAAARAYDAAAREAHGEYVVLNFPASVGSEG